MDKQAYQLRHIALSVPDVAAAQRFFEEAFGMTHAGNTQNGICITASVWRAWSSTSQLRTKV